MLESIAGFLGNIAVYITALLGLVAVYFLWVAFREWRAGQRAVFGIERDIATSEMMGALARAGIVVVVGLVVFGLGQLGQEVEPVEDEPVQPTQPPLATISVFGTATPVLGTPVPTAIPTGTSQLAVTAMPPLESPPTEAPVLEPTPQAARVTAFGGVWLRDAPNGGAIVVLPIETIVQLMEGREFSGSFDWQMVRVMSTPPGSEAQVGQEGWVAAQFLEASP
jgi:hypothetical protein